jgi:hypothetical protein
MGQSKRTILRSQSRKVGRQILLSTTTADSAVGAGTVGANLYTSETVASAQAAIAAGAVGTNLFEAATTASAQTNIGGTDRGIELFQAATTAVVRQLVSSPDWTS